MAFSLFMVVMVSSTCSRVYLTTARWLLQSATSHLSNAHVRHSGK